MNEIWKTHPSYVGYEVSNLGRVRSVSRWVTCASVIGLPFRRWCRGRVLHPAPKPSGHLSVVVHGHSRNVHTLVLETFVGPAPDKHESHHANGRPADSRLTNLSWALKRRNTQDRKHHNGAANHKLTPAQVRVVRRTDEREVPRGYWAALARQYGVTSAAIYGARKLHHRDIL